MKISVIGTGYVGLVTGTCLAELGNKVTCIDSNQQKITQLLNGLVPFYEPGLEERIKRNTDAGRLFFSKSLEESFVSSDVIFIAVGTPPLPSGEADLSAVFSVASDVMRLYQTTKQTGFKVLVTKSTVPVGTGAKIEAIKEEFEISDDQISVCSNPEFLREGTAIYDFFHPDRIVLGSSSQAALDVMSELYDPLYRRETPIVKTNLQTSELSKYASNAFLATKISFINEMANICEESGADVNDISKIMGMDGRIGKYFLHPGPGYGGSCFPKDTQAIVHFSDRLNYDLKIVKAVEEVNALQKKRVLTYIKSYFGENLEGKKFVVLGIAFKPNTDDIRESSSLIIIQELLKLGATVAAVDPEVKSVDEFSSISNFNIEKSSYEAAQNADAIILATEWNMFKELDLKRLKESMNEPVFFDLRNIYSPEKLQSNGFNAYVIGRKRLSKKS